MIPSQVVVRFHKGIDFASRPGTPIRVVADGIVTRAESRRGYGLMVEVNHGNGYVTRYAHASKILVRSGEKVTRGQQDRRRRLHRSLHRSSSALRSAVER